MALTLQAGMSTLAEEGAKRRIELKTYYSLFLAAFVACSTPTSSTHQITTPRPEGDQPAQEGGPAQEGKAKSASSIDGLQGDIDLVTEDTAS
ncbi:MAG: hypothetical protein ACRD2L_07980, partial [Terriglobia bacterium]